MAKRKPRKKDRHYHSVAQFKAALKKNAGLYAQTAVDLGISRQAVRDRVLKSEAMKRFHEEISEEILDRAESVILKKIVGDTANKIPPCDINARWYLERKGKKRGYAIKAEVTGVLADNDLEAIVSSFGGDLARLRALRAALNSEEAG